MLGTLCSSSSVRRNDSCSRICRLSSASVSSIRFSRKRMCAVMSLRTLMVASFRRFFSAASICTSSRRRVTTAANSRSSSDF